VINVPPSPSKSPSCIEITRLPTPDVDDDDDELKPTSSIDSTYHIYSAGEVHKLISPTIDPTKDRRSGPTLKEQKASRISRKTRKAAGLPPTIPDSNAFFLHRPYLAFHCPPSVLYTGNSKYETTPTILIHPSLFWREYKLQLGPAIGAPGVLDPRGVVCWKHNGGDKLALKSDPHKLKGYKVRTWRLWGETGKAYVRRVKKIRKTGDGIDPDTIDGRVLAKEKKANDTDLLDVAAQNPSVPVRANEVVTLRWTSPFSRQTRTYHFSYRGLDFSWKGTGTVKESRRCGMFLRFNHLKLVVKVPLSPVPQEKDNEKSITATEKDERLEICLGKFTSSVAHDKSGTLVLFDKALVRLVDEYVPGMLVEEDHLEKGRDEEDDFQEKVSRLKKSSLYQVIVATATCMIASEKEKRHTLIDVLVALAEGGAGAGG
jgi:hypothetical protein